MIRYDTGEEVRVGGVMRCEVGGPPERVRVFEPNTPDAEGFICEQTGGVLMEPSGIMFIHTVGWEDLEFVSRGPQVP